LETTTKEPATYAAKPLSSKTSGERLFLLMPTTCSTSKDLTYNKHLASVSAERLEASSRFDQRNRTRRISKRTPYVREQKMPCCPAYRFPAVSHCGFCLKNLNNGRSIHRRQTVSLMVRCGSVLPILTKGKERRSKRGNSAAKSRANATGFNKVPMKIRKGIMDDTRTTRNHALIHDSTVKLDQSKSKTKNKTWRTDPRGILFFKGIKKLLTSFK